MKHMVRAAVIFVSLVSAFAFAGQAPSGTDPPSVVQDAGGQVFNVRAYGAKGDGAADDTTAIKTAIHAASAHGGEVFFPPGTYLISSPLPFLSGLRYSGPAMGAYDAVQPVKIVTSNSDIFALSAGTSGAMIENLDLLSSRGGGHIFNFNGHNVTRSTFRNLLLAQSNPARSILSSVCQNSTDCRSGGTGFFGNWFENIDATYAASNSVPAFFIKNNVINQVSFEKMRVTGYQYASNYAFWVESTNPQGYAFDVTFRQITFEVPTGGAIKLLAAAQSEVVDCGVYDTAPPKNAVFSVGTSSAGLTSMDVKFDGVFCRLAGSSPQAPDLGIASGSVTVINSMLRYVAGLGKAPASIVQIGSALTPYNLTRTVVGRDIEWDTTVTTSNSYAVTNGGPGNYDGFFFVKRNGASIGGISPTGALFWGNGPGSKIQLTSNGLLQSPNFGTAANCASASSPAQCGAAAAGSVVLAAGSTTLTVDTSAVTANSQIFVQEDRSLATRPGVICDATPGRTYTISARVPGSNFTLSSSSPPLGHPTCLSFFMVN
jgi:hypothetical protein